MKANDHGIYNYLYDNYSPAMYGIVLKIVQDEELAKDVLQESFVKLWKSIASYDSSKGRLFTWMLNICRNTALDVKRSKAFRQSAITEKEEVFSKVRLRAGDMGIKPETIGIKQIVSELPPEHEEIIDLLYYKGYTQSETAEKLNLPLGTVKTRVKIAMREMRKLFSCIF